MPTQARPATRRRRPPGCRCERRSSSTPVSFCLRTSQEEHVLSLLHRFVTLVEQSHREGADATIGLLVGMFVLHNNPSLNGVTDEDRSQEFAAELKQREHRCLKNSYAVDQAQIHVVNEGAMRDAGPERAE